MPDAIGRRSHQMGVVPDLLTKLPAVGPNDEIVQSWDTASKAEELNDYSVCTTWHIKNKQYYLIDVLRARLDYPTLKKRVIEHARRHNTRTVLIENAGSGIQLLQDLRATSDLTADRHAARRR